MPRETLDLSALILDAANHLGVRSGPSVADHIIGTAFPKTLASAKEEGLNVRAIGKAAKELRMAPEKLQKRLEDEAQLDLLRDALGLTGAQMREAAE